MEVSDEGAEVAQKAVADTGGHELIQTIVSLTGIPEILMRKELDQILDSSGQDPQNLTLDQLRLALVAHLEALQAEFVDSET